MDEILLWLTGAVVVWLALHSQGAHAETNAQKVFGRWVAVTPETMLIEVPEWEPSRSLPGSVTKQYRNQTPLADRPAEPGEPPMVSPRSSAPEQVAGLNSLERR